MVLIEVVWLIVLMVNQSILIYHLLNSSTKRELLTEDAVELLTSPYDLATYKEAIMEAIFKGTRRYIESEEPKQKNAIVG